LVAAAAAALLTLGTLLSAGAEPRSAFGVGVLRRDGIVVPFGAFDGKRWSNGWPLPDVDVNVPITVRDVPSKWWGPTPMLETWQAWTEPQPQMLRVRQLDWIDCFCVRQIGLRTDYQPATPAPPPTEQPYPKDGLAVSPPQPVDRISVVPTTSNDARVLMPALLDAFNAAERGIAEDHDYPVSRRGREGRVPDIEAIYAFGEHPRIYYVESSRRYRSLGQRPDECAGVAYANSWFARDGDAVRPLRTDVDLLGCDRAGASYMLPLGVIRAADRVFWLSQFSGWDQERYVVIEIKPKIIEAVLSVWGGSCQR
jgi:hypothetical protein